MFELAFDIFIACLAWTLGRRSGRKQVLDLAKKQFSAENMRKVLWQNSK